MEDIKLIIFDLMKIKFRGIINIASGKKIFLKDIAKLILKKYKKKIMYSLIIKNLLL